MGLMDRCIWLVSLSTYRHVTSSVLTLFNASSQTGHVFNSSSQTFMSLMLQVRPCMSLTLRVLWFVNYRAACPWALTRSEVRPISQINNISIYHTLNSHRNNDLLVINMPIEGFHVLRQPLPVRSNEWCGYFWCTIALFWMNIRQTSKL